MQKLLIILSALLLSFPVISQTKQIEKLREQQKAILEDIKNTNKLFLDVKKETTTILQRINLINKQISSRKEMMKLQSQEIAELDRELKRIESEIKKLDEELVAKKDNYANAARTLQTNRSSQNELFFVLSGKSFGESLRRMQYLKEYSKWRRAQANEIKKKNQELSKRKSDFEQTKLDRVSALQALEEEEKKLKEEESIKQKEMSIAKGKQQNIQKTLREREKQKKKIDQQIEQMIAEEVARQEREAAARRKAEEAKRAAEEKKRATTAPKQTETAKTTTSKSAQPEPKVAAAKSSVNETFALSKNFVSNKGKLPMPVTGTSSIVSQFGVNRHSEWNISTNSNGIDIQAQSSSNIRSVFEGEVSKVAYFPGMNTCVIVRHGDYYTFYANIYDIHVKIGDKIKTGQSLGSIYTDPDTGIATMHFQLWHKTSKLNPTPWLKR